MAFKQMWLDSSDLDVLCTVLARTEEDIETSYKYLDTDDERAEVERLERRVQWLMKYIRNVQARGS